MTEKRLELIFLALMEEKGVEDKCGLEDFYGWVVSVLEDAVEDFKADTGWEEEE